MVPGFVMFIHEWRNCGFLMTSSVSNVICIGISDSEKGQYGNILFVVLFVGDIEIGFCGFV